MAFDIGMTVMVSAKNVLTLVHHDALSVRHYICKCGLMSFRWDFALSLSSLLEDNNNNNKANRSTMSCDIWFDGILIIHPFIPCTHSFIYYHTQTHTQSAICSAHTVFSWCMCVCVMVCECVAVFVCVIFFPF